VDDVESIECIDELVRKGIRASPLTRLMNYRRTSEKRN